MQPSQQGPTLEISEQIHKEKYRGKAESFYESQNRVAATLGDSEEHRRAFRSILLDQRFLPGGRVQSAIGSPRRTTAFNCFVSGTIEDSMKGIMDKATEAALTMKQGGGIGYDFSTIRYNGRNISTLNSSASGTLSFMRIYDAVCSTVSSAGNRRGAQMGVLRVDHPDIEEFIRAKQNQTELRHFNLSVGVTDKFMEALQTGDSFDLMWEGEVVETIDPKPLWEELMRATWDWAEPGVLFIDRMNEENNLKYCETIATSNPCGEQPLPPYGACLLGSFNLTKYVQYYQVDDKGERSSWFDFDQLKKDIPDVVRAMDNAIGSTIYPLPQQEAEAKSKRRMGLGVTGVANALEALGHPYGSPEFISVLKGIMKTLRNESYKASIELAKEKGKFPAYRKAYLDSPYIQRLPKKIWEGIEQYGLRNSHLISIAPCGTISLTANNVSSSIEPVFAYNTKRLIKTAEGDREVNVPDYGYRHFGVEGKTSDKVTIQDHLDVLLACQPYVDSAVSKTCNVGDEVLWEDFKKIYEDAWKGRAKGITTFRMAGKRFGIMSKVEDVVEGAACTIDWETGKRTCE